MVRFEKVELTISSKLEVSEVDSDGPRSWLVTISVMACGGLLPYDIRKAIDTKTFCLACTDPGFKWIPLDFADKSILMFRIFELEQEEDNCKIEFVADIHWNESKTDSSITVLPRIKITNLLSEGREGREGVYCIF